MENSVQALSNRIVHISGLGDKVQEICLNSEQKYMEMKIQEKVKRKKDQSRKAPNTNWIGIPESETVGQRKDGNHGGNSSLH